MLHDDIEKAQEMVDTGGWPNWETAFLKLCGEHNPSSGETQKQIEIVVKTVFELYVNELLLSSRIQALQLLLPQFILSANPELIDWRYLASYYLKKYEG